MNLRKSIKRVASFIRISSMDFERLAEEYERDPENPNMRLEYIRECLRRGEEPIVYSRWLKATHGLAINLAGKQIDIRGNLEDLGWLNGVYSQAEGIVFSANKLKSLKGVDVSSFPNLSNLIFLFQDLNDLTGLSGINAPNLQVFTANGCKLKSIDGIEGLNTMNLRDITLNSNAIKDLKPLNGLNIKTLSIASNENVNLDSIKNLRLPSLRALDLGNTGITNIRHLEGMDFPQLGWLGLQNNNISSLDELPIIQRLFPRLHTLWLNDNPVKVTKRTQTKFPFVQLGQWTWVGMDKA